MLMNNLDPEVAERPDDLVVYGGIGKAARNWECFDADRRGAAAAEDDETLLVQSGKPVGVFRTHADAPRVLIANSNLVPHWATWEHFNELDRKGLMMYGQMTAGSWIYIGTQGIVQGTYETFVEVGRQHFARRRSRASGSSRRAWAAWAARSRWPRPWPAPRCWRSSATGRASTSACRRATSTSRRDDLDEALEIIDARGAHRRAGLGRPARQRREVLPELVRARRAPATLVTDQTSAHDPRQRLPARRLDARAVGPAAARGPGAGRRARRAPRMAAHVRGDARLPEAPACRSSTTATTSARSPSRRACKDAFDFPGFVPAYIRPLFCEGIGPFRWVALSGDPEDIYTTDAKVQGTVPRRRAPAPLARHGARAHPVPGPAGAHLLAGARGARTAWASPSTRWWRAGSSRPRSSSAATTSTPARWPAPTARPRRCRTARTRSPTGRCSTRCSTPPAAPPGSRSTTAAASAWATRQHAGVVIVCDGTAGGRAAHRAGAVERPRHRRHAPRRCRLRRSPSRARASRA